MPIKGNKRFLPINHIIPSGHIVELDRRYVIADGDCTADHMLRIPMTRYQSETTMFAPQENIRMKKQGGGMNFVHGGISLQEMVVPVIDFQNIRASSKKFVDVKKVELQLISQSRKVSNSMSMASIHSVRRSKLISKRCSKRDI